MNHGRSIFTTLALLGVLAGVGGCKAGSDKYLCKSRQAEAKVNLGALHASQKSYFGEHKTYAKTLAEAAFSPSGSKYYDVTIDAASATGYTATATGKAEAAGDVWTVDQNGTPTAKTDRCK